MRWIIISLLLHTLIFFIPFSFSRREDTQIKLNYKFKQRIEEVSERKESRKKFPQDSKINVFQGNIFTEKSSPHFIFSSTLKGKQIFSEGTFLSSSFTKIPTSTLSPLNKRENYPLLESKKESKGSFKEPLFSGEKAFSIISLPFSVQQKEGNYLLTSCLPDYSSVKSFQNVATSEKIALSKENLLFACPLKDVYPIKKNKKISSQKISSSYSPIKINQNNAKVVFLPYLPKNKEIPLPEKDFLELKIKKDFEPLFSLKPLQLKNNTFSKKLSREYFPPSSSISPSLYNPFTFSLKLEKTFSEKRKGLSFPQKNSRIKLDHYFSPNITFSLKEPHFIEEKTYSREISILKNDKKILPFSTFILYSEKIIREEKKIKFREAKIKKETYSLPLDRGKISADLSCLSWVNSGRIKEKVLLAPKPLPPEEEGRKIFFPLPSPLNLVFFNDKGESLPSPVMPLQSRDTRIDSNYPLPILPESFLFDDYLKKILETIEKNKKYPYMARKRKEEGKVKVSFTLLKNGKVEDVKIISPSPYPELNKATEKLIRELSPFPPFPSEVKKEKITLVMEVIYELKEGL